MQYITLKSIKRNLGFKGLEINDIFIAIPFLFLFFLFFCFTSFKIESLSILIIAFFLLLPINLSQKNRMYKVLMLLINFMIRRKIFIFIEDRGNFFEFKRRKKSEKVQTEKKKW